MHIPKFVIIVILKKIFNRETKSNKNTEKGLK